MIERDHGYLTIARIAGEPAELTRRYGRWADTMNAVGRDHGLLVHAAASTSEGLMLVNVWPSAEGSETAAADPRRLAALAEAGIEPGQVSREHWGAQHVVLFDVGEGPG